MNLFNETSTHVFESPEWLSAQSLTGFSTVALGAGFSTETVAPKWYPETITTEFSTDALATGFTTDPLTSGLSTEALTTGLFTEANVSTPSPALYGPTLLSFLTIIIAVITVLTTAGNVLVVIAFATDAKLRTFGNWFILNLAITDLMVGLLIPVYAPYALLGTWPYGKRGCVGFMVIDYIVPLSSSWNIALISLDRYTSVAYPVEYRVRQSVPKALLLMSIPWLAGFFVFAPAIIAWEHVTGKSSVPDKQCYVEFFDHVPFLLFSSVMEFIVPFIVVLTANLLIYVNIRRRSRAAAAHAHDNESKKKDLTRDKKTARNLAILVGIYGLTWAPYEVCALCNPLCGFCIPDKVFEITFWFLWCNSTINPVLYPFLQVKFRVAFTRILCCRRSVVMPMSNA